LYTGAESTESATDESRLFQAVVGKPKVVRPEDGMVYIMVDGNGKVLTSVETEIEKVAVVYSG
jgi:hypothetical protein